MRQLDSSGRLKRPRAARRQAQALAAPRPALYERLHGANRRRRSPAGSRFPSPELRVAGPGLRRPGIDPVLAAPDEVDGQSQESREGDPAQRPGASGAGGEPSGDAEEDEDLEQPPPLR